MNLQIKRKEATSLCPRGFGNVEPLGRIATKRLYHKVMGTVKCFFAVFCIILAIFLVMDTHARRNPALLEVEHVVTYGDTLWGIAEKYKPDGMSMGEYMGWVYERNCGGVIYPGDVVIVGIRNEE